MVKYKRKKNYLKNEILTPMSFKFRNKQLLIKKIPVVYVR